MKFSLAAFLAALACTVLVSACATSPKAGAASAKGAQPRQNVTDDTFWQRAEQVVYTDGITESEVLDQQQVRKMLSGMIRLRNWSSPRIFNVRKGYLVADGVRYMCFSATDKDSGKEIFEVQYGSKKMRFIEK